MNADPTMNVVVFAVKCGDTVEPLTAQGMTTAPDCVRMAWAEVQRQHNVRPQDVQEIFSEWEPSRQDMQFLEAYFPANLAVSYSFARPSEDGWSEALAEARRTIMESQARETTETIQEQRKNFTLLPILRNADSLSEAMVHFSLTRELCFVLARVGLTERGAIGIDYMMAKSLTETGTNPVPLWEEAFSNLTSGLQINAARHDRGTYFIINRQGGMAAAAIGLPDFPQNAAEWAASQQLIVGIPNPDIVLLCSVRSPLVRFVQNQTLNSNYAGAINLTPSVLFFDNGKWSLQARRTEP